MKEILNNRMLRRIPEPPPGTTPEPESDPWKCPPAVPGQPPEEDYRNRPVKQGTKFR